MADVWKHRAEKPGLTASLDKQGGEIFYVKIVQQFGIIFNVNPQEQVLWVPFTHGLESVVIIAASVAPGSAIARNKPGVGIGQRLERLGHMLAGVLNEHNESANSRG